MTDKSRLWPSARAPSPVSRRALLAAMPKRDLAREAELARKAEAMAHTIRTGLSNVALDRLEQRLEQEQEERVTIHCGTPGYAEAVQPMLDRQMERIK